MSHVNTLEVCDKYRAAGFDDATARALTNILENSFMTKVNELKEDFASNKVVNIWGSIVAFFGAILIGIGGFTLVKVWDLSHDMVDVKNRLTTLEDRIK